MELKRETGKRNLKHQLSETSSESSSAQSDADGIAIPVTVEQLCSNSLLSARLEHQLTRQSWVRDKYHVRLSYESSHTLLQWKVGNDDDDIYVFAFTQRRNGKKYYVTTPKQRNKRLFLTARGSSPDRITDPRSDRRCITYKYNTKTGGFMLFPTSDNGESAIGLVGQYAGKISSEDPDKWEIK